jgi:hypothetical protein
MKVQQRDHGKTGPSETEDGARRLSRRALLLGTAQLGIACGLGRAHGVIAG